MNQVFERLAGLAYDPGCAEYIDLDKYSDLLIKDVVKTLQERWYSLNSEVPPETETHRELGIRIGRKTETIYLLHLIKQRYETNS